jgi:hypothetical protein
MLHLGSRKQTSVLRVPCSESQATGNASAASNQLTLAQDYHVPVSGGTGKPVRLRVAHVTVEMAPVAKVSGCPVALSVWSSGYPPGRRHR